MMYTMPKNLLSICVNFALATQLLFKPLFRSTAAPLSDSFNRLPQREAGVNTFLL